MSLDKGIKHGKEKRKPYYGSKAVDPACRNHKSCVWCRRGRLHKKIVEEERAKDMESMRHKC